ncbi:hypothetical protein V8D89_002840 [Ganoderma adspersum]
MATHANRRRPSVAWDPTPTYIRIDRDDSPATPTAPHQNLAHSHPQQLPRSLSGLHPVADPRAYQQQSSQVAVPGVHPHPGQYAQPAGPVYPGTFHAQYLAGTAVPGAPHYAAAAASGYGATGYGYPAAGSPAHTPSAPLMGNAALPPTPSETTPMHSPGPSTSSLDAQPGSPHTPSSSSWGTPSPEPDERPEPGSHRGDLSPHLAQFGLKWDMRGEELKALQRPPWFGEQAFASGRTRCTVFVHVGGPQPETVDVPRRADGRALTVGDVLGALDGWLWEVVGDDAVYRPAAADELSYRHRGAEDGAMKAKTFRNVDHFADDRAIFVGLDEVPGKTTASTLFLRAGRE